MEILHELLINLANIAITFFELIGVIIIIISGIRGVIGYLRNDPFTRLNLAKGMAMGLEFKLGSEILRTVIVHEFSEIAIVGAIVILRAALTFIIHWEIKNEEPELEGIEEKAENVNSAPKFRPMQLINNIKPHRYRRTN
ncbi:DUF1622 domain-containing protein [Alloiococcus sp. CFN-8]|uniref:DUF1622 domain-containing protein n=1 Tax=Alloiococcus sp. CFN-8 TaxID=3416081 RepID=UPI003CEB1423